MVRRHQGVGSSPTSPTNTSGYRRPTILKRHRKRMGKLDRQIHEVDITLEYLHAFDRSILSPHELKHLKKFEDRRARLDKARKQLRLWMKGYYSGS